MKFSLAKKRYLFYQAVLLCFAVLYDRPQISSNFLCISTYFIQERESLGVCEYMGGTGGSDERHASRFTNVTPRFAFPARLPIRLT